MQNPDPTKRDHFVFGAGRRVCQGMHIADVSLFLGASRLLWAFDFRRPVDPATGREAVPDAGSRTEGLFIQPTPFEARIVPRSERRAALIREEWARARELLDAELQWKALPENLVWKGYVPSNAKVAA